MWSWKFSSSHKAFSLSGSCGSSPGRPNSALNEASSSPAKSLGSSQAEASGEPCGLPGLAMTLERSSRVVAGRSSGRRPIANVTLTHDVPDPGGTRLKGVPPPAGGGVPPEPHRESAAEPEPSPSSGSPAEPGRISDQLLAEVLARDPGAERLSAYSGLQSVALSDGTALPNERRAREWIQASRAPARSNGTAPAEVEQDARPSRRSSR
jgi:hypothetical protein